MELGNAEAIKKLVGAGLGLSISSAMAVKAEVKDRTLVAVPLSPPLWRRLGIIKRRDKPESPALRELLSTIATLRRPRDCYGRKLLTAMRTAGRASGETAASGPSRSTAR
jgi:DNA-binding transcriptional LysR family regulator